LNVVLFLCGYQSNPKLIQGEIGMTLNSDWIEPLTDSEADIAIAEK